MGWWVWFWVLLWWKYCVNVPLFGPMVVNGNGVLQYIGFQLGNCIVQWIISLLIMFWNARTIGICLFCFTGSYQCTSLHISGAHIILWYKPGKINKFGIPEWWFFSPVRFRPLWWTNRKPPFYFNCSCLHPWNWFTAMDASF